MTSRSAALSHRPDRWHANGLRVCRLNKHAVKVELEGPSQEHHNTVKFKLTWVECLPEKFQDDPHSSALTSLKATAVESLSNELSKKLVLDTDVAK